MTFFKVNPIRPSISCSCSVFYYLKLFMVVLWHECVVVFGAKIQSRWGFFYMKDNPIKPSIEIQHFWILLIFLYNVKIVVGVLLYLTQIFFHNNLSYIWPILQKSQYNDPEHRRNVPIDLENAKFTRFQTSG